MSSRTSLTRLNDVPQHLGNRLIDCLASLWLIGVRMFGGVVVMRTIRTKLSSAMRLVRPRCFPVLECLKPVVLKFFTMLSESTRRSASTSCLQIMFRRYHQGERKLGLDPKPPYRNPRDQRDQRGRFSAPRRHSRLWHRESVNTVFVSRRRVPVFSTVTPAIADRSEGLPS